MYEEIITPNGHDIRENGILTYRHERRVLSHGKQYDVVVYRVENFKRGITSAVQVKEPVTAV